MSKAEEVMESIDSGDYSDIEVKILESIQQDDEQTQYSLAETLMSIGFTVQAKIIYEHLNELYPTEGQILSRLAEISISEDNMDEALGYISEITPGSEAYAQNLLVSADIYQAQGLYEVSEQKLLEGIRMFPDEEVFKFALAELYFDENKFSSAITYYDFLLDEDIKTYSGISITMRKASALSGIGEYEEAIEEYNKLNALELNEDSQYQLGFLYNQVKDYSKSISTLESLLDTNKDYPTAYATLADDYLNLKDNQEAFRYAQLGLNLNELDENLYRIAFESGINENPDEALSIITKGIETVENPLPLIISLSDYYISHGRYQLNLDLLENSELNNNPKLIWNLAKSYFELGDIKKSKEFIVTVLEDYKDNLDYLTDLVQILQSTGDNDLLKVALQLYIKINPDNEVMNDLWEQLN
ncbi:tetratricopeptide repeat protein [Lactobacillus terrae]|uniref:tetratricopeptide repeat protein n=1 Tax=Lactobacillus terrae TaxID=2269374 RepID=UPI000C1B6072|nr:hypothetical protein [Lactobacillus terrae]